MVISLKRLISTELLVSFFLQDLNQQVDMECREGKSTKTSVSIIVSEISKAKNGQLLVLTLILHDIQVQIPPYL